MDAKLTRQQLQDLARTVARTRHDEISCDAMLDRLASYAERGQALPDSERSAVESHLAICPECTEEYHALLTAIRSAESRHADEA